MLSDDLWALARQGREVIRDPDVLVEVFDRLEVCAQMLGAMERSAIVAMPAPPDNVVSLDERRRRDD